MSEMDTEHFSPYRADGKLVRLAIHTHPAMRVKTDCYSMVLSVLLLELSSLLGRQSYKS
jgi:hemoglobin-like flavoprotein